MIRYGKNSIAFWKITDKSVYLSIQSTENRVVHPGLLNKLKLPSDVSVKTNEQESPSLPIIKHPI
jgi:hypothetical protein